MDVTYTCQAAPGVIANDDYVISSERFAIVLDGATAPLGIESGCIHDVPWLTANLASKVAWLLATKPLMSLTEVLKRGIVAIMDEHAATCDLDNRDSPSTTIAFIRVNSDHLDYLVLGDSPVIIEMENSELQVVHDDRTSHLKSYTKEAVSLARNTDEGFWVASIRPEAADRALVGSVPVDRVRRVLMVTDGASRLVERYGYDWPGLLDKAYRGGPGSLVEAVRAHERATPAGTYRGKQFDDATVVLCTFPTR